MARIAGKSASVAFLISMSRFLSWAWLFRRLVTCL
jgi:hypothetical protein